MFGAPQPDPPSATDGGLAGAVSDRVRSTQAIVDALEREITTLAGHLNAANYRFLTLLAEFDRRGAYSGTGIASCAHWLSWRCGIGLIAARDKVRVARAIQGLPKVADAMRRGVISYCKARALTRIATPENEHILLAIAESGTVSHVEKLVRLYRKYDRGRELERANAAFADRYLRCYVDDDGCVVVKARLAPEQGAAFMKAVRSAADALRDAESDSRESGARPDTAYDARAARNADAAGLLAETYLAQQKAPVSAPERHLVTIHVDEAVLRDPTCDGRCEVEDQASVPPETARRLACDASVVRVLEHAEPGPSTEAGAAPTICNLGRKTRVVSTSLRRALDARDGGCQFPGCTNARFVDAHHIVHWAEGGPTVLTNLVLLCRRHHRFVHEYGYRVERTPAGFEFRNRYGHPIVRASSLTARDADEACSELYATHQRAGLDIDHDTGDAHWRGEDMDYDWVLRALYARSDVEEEPHKAVPRSAHAARQSGDADCDDGGESDDDVPRHPQPFGRHRADRSTSWPPS